MTYETINYQDAIDLFHQLMQPTGNMRILRLLGEEKMGKTRPGQNGGKSKWAN